MRISEWREGKWEERPTVGIDFGLSCDNSTYYTTYGSLTYGAYPLLSTVSVLPDCAQSDKIQERSNEKPMNTQKMSFKVGDRCIVTNWGSTYDSLDSMAIQLGLTRFVSGGMPKGITSSQWKTARTQCKVIGVNNNYIGIQIEDGTQYVVGSSALEVIETSISKVNAVAENLLDADTKALVEAGIVNECLEITPKGQDIINALNFAQHKVELVKQAKEEIKAAKAKK